MCHMKIHAENIIELAWNQTEEDLGNKPGSGLTCIIPITAGLFVNNRTNFSIEMVFVVCSKFHFSFFRNI